ncbi:MAG: heavy metal-binding domain-containing protein [Myxococcota bacterium]
MSTGLWACGKKTPTDTATAPPTTTAPPMTMAHDHHEASDDAVAPAAAATKYTCSMHPEVVMDHPGRCPKCGMTLVPMTAAEPAHDHDGMAGMGHMDGMGGMAMAGKPSDIEARLTFGATLEAGKPVPVNFAYRHHTSDTAVSDIVPSHTELVHLFVISDDLATYAHVHPEAAAAPGEFDLAVTFPTPGRYHVYSDFTSTGDGPTVTATPVEVPGAAPAPVPLVADAELAKVVDGLKVALTPSPSPLVAGQDVMLTYHVSDAASGAAVTDLEPYLGAMGHLFILNRDLAHPDHAHPQGAEPAADARGGPDIMFHTHLEKPGLTKLWLQLQRHGQVETVPLVIDVQAAP